MVWPGAGAQWSVTMVSSCRIQTMSDNADTHSHAHHHWPGHNLLLAKDVLQYTGCLKSLSIVRLAVTCFVWFFRDTIWCTIVWSGYDKRLYKTRDTRHDKSSCLVTKLYQSSEWWDQNHVSVCSVTSGGTQTLSWSYWDLILLQTLQFYLNELQPNIWQSKQRLVLVSWLNI